MVTFCSPTSSFTITPLMLPKDGSLLATAVSSKLKVVNALFALGGVLPPLSDTVRVKSASPTAPRFGVIDNVPPTLPLV
jgi:hypothetical protein